jgi:hypothetical protein
MKDTIPDIYEMNEKYVDIAGTFVFSQTEVVVAKYVRDVSKERVERKRTQ